MNVATLARPTIAASLVQKNQMAETGTIKWYEPSKRFGFIEMSDGDVFFHKSDLQKYGILERNITKGRAVKFNAIQKPGLRREVTAIALA